MVLALKKFFITILQRWQVAFLFNNMTLSTQDKTIRSQHTLTVLKVGIQDIPLTVKASYTARQCKKCYGCGSEFTDRHRSPPHNIMVKHVDRRLVRRDERTGNFLFSAYYSYTYYHLDFTHIQRKNPFFNGQVFISFHKLSSLNNFQCNIILNCNLKVTVIWHFCYWTGSFHCLFQNRQETILSFFYCCWCSVQNIELQSLSTP